LHIHHTLIELPDKFILGEPKTACSKRPVVLPQIAMKALREHRKTMFAEGHAGSKVFCDTKGGWVHRDNLRNRSFYRIIKETNLPKIRIHDLRHSLATLLLKAGTHPSIVAAQLGHASVKTTLDIYSHVLPEMLRKAADEVDEAFVATNRQPNDRDDDAVN